jgi:YadA-like membrane anchor domain
VTSAASRAAQTGPTQIVTSDASGNLATATLAGLGLASTADIAGINAQLAGINSRLDGLTTMSNRATTGVAMAFAMAGVPTVMPNERFVVSMNWGNFQSANGLALNAALRLDNRVQLNAGVGYGANQNIVGARAGLRIGW